MLENALEIYWNSKKTIHTLKYVAANYSVFDFLLGLGEYFITIKEFHKYSLNDVFYILRDYVRANYADDQILNELIGIDYYLHFKVKPQLLFLEELNRPDKNSFIEKHKLDHHSFRFVIIPISFNFNHFVITNEIMKVPSYFIAQYNGLSKASLLELNEVILPV
jgi:hypothetical protein